MLVAWRAETRGIPSTDERCLKIIPLLVPPEPLERLEPRISRGRREVTTGAGMGGCRAVAPC